MTHQDRQEKEKLQLIVEDGYKPGAIYSRVMDNGERIFFELVGMLDNPKLNGKNLYKRLLIRKIEVI